VGGNPNTYLVEKKTQALSGQIKTTSLTFGASERYAIRTINDTDIINWVDNELTKYEV
jgi:hypothetical protein